MNRFRHPLHVAAAVIAAVAGVLPRLAGAQGCAANPSSDWMSRALAGNVLAQDIRPRDCDTVQQTPPDFRWPDVISSGGYTLTLTYPDGSQHSQATSQNLANWPSVLPAGSYKWSVNYSGGSASATRSFIVNAASQPFAVPDMQTTINNILAKQHPRSLPDAATLASIANQRAGPIGQVMNDVSRSFGMAFPSQASSEDDVWIYSKYAIASIESCVLSQYQTSWCGDAVAKLMALGNWSTSTSDQSSYWVHDMAGRYLTWVLAIGYDWLYPRLDAGQRTTLLNSIGSRTALIYNDLVGTRSRVAQQPRDSHANQALAYLPVLAGIVAGDLPIASQTWLPNALPLALNAISPWGGEEGGFANATTQGTWDMGELEYLFYELRLISGIDVAKKPWVRNWANWFAYFTPPGMSGGTTAFGDGYELNESEHQARYGKGYTYFAPSPIGRWHMSQLNAEDPTRFEIIMAPPADFSGPQPFPPGTPDSLYLRSIGMAAMHSDLSNPARVSVYFKSSPPPFGAFNHGHADQNSFVVNAGGQRLAIESGYYDNYKTQHWWNWYHQTLSKNAVTYDGGKGQVFLEAGAMGYGRITGFLTTAGYDIVTGDATPAYGGALGLAQRSLIFLRPNLVVVYDNLTAPVAHRWEWNIHALNQMTGTSPTTARISSGGQSLCVTMLSEPASTQFSQTSRFTVDPAGIAWSPQWHGKFHTGSQPSAEFVALLNVGCTPVNAASASKSNGVWTIAAGSATITIGGGAISVTGAGTSTTSSAGTGTMAVTAGTSAGTTTATGTRALATYAGKPYSGTPIALPGNFEAENFDLGGQDVAYRDTTPGNLGAQYRPAEDVDIINSCDTAGGAYVVNNFTSGEWLSYTVNAAAGGSYAFQLRTSNNQGSTTPAYHLEVDGVRTTPSISVPQTGDWCTFQWVPAPPFHLTAGKHVIRIVSDQGFFNLNSVAASAAEAPPKPAPR